MTELVTDLVFFIDDKISTFARQCKGDPFTDSATRRGDEGNFAS